MDYIEFQDRSTPLAYFISFRCYGTWLHGDERGSVDRKLYNRYGSPKIPPANGLVSKEHSKLKHSPIRLDARMRSAVATAINQVCDFREYRLIALQVRTNHGHCVVSANAKPEFVMNSFKSYATRKLVSSGLIAAKTKVWSRHGSTRYLWTEEQIAAAAEYVVNGQSDELPTL